jgi:hypothetical protein
MPGTRNAAAPIRAAGGVVARSMKEVAMATRTARGSSRKGGRVRRTLAVDAEPTPRALGNAERDPDDWTEAEGEGDRLGESEAEMLLTGHAATHGNEAEDNWLIETDETNWNER